MKPQITVAEVREGLRRIIADNGYSREDVVAMVKKASGERYSHHTLDNFLKDGNAAAAWLRYAQAILRAFPRIASRCPHCGSTLGLSRENEKAEHSHRPGD